MLSDLPSVFLLFPNPPDLALRQPFTPAATLPLVLSHYALAVLAILPNTFIFKLSLLPIILWQAWCCTVKLDFSIWLAQLVGVRNADRLNFWNFTFVVGMLSIVLKSLEWTFIKKPLRRYEIQKGQGSSIPTERRLSISNVLLDALDLFCNQRGIGWSWSTNPFPRESIPLPSIATILAKTLFKVVVFDTSQYLIHYVRPSIANPGGDSLFDPSLDPIPRTIWAAFAAIFGGIWAYTMVDSIYHIATLVGRIFLRQPASQWPPLFHRPWMSTSIHEFWSVRWHQLFRRVFIIFGARPGGTLLGRYSALMGGFTVSALLHHIGVWGLGRGSEFSTTGGFFLLMGVGIVMESVFSKVTGLRVKGCYGWAWTMLWTLLWGSFMLDGWARHGMLVNAFLPNWLRPGKVLVDTIIHLSRHGLSLVFFLNSLVPKTWMLRSRGPCHCIT
ncbi:hypothetical protein B0F90DRAFT_1939935 [Multifurca ochricompacta]|uniref:Wax synthase domain-containing protein n=1 Tax=Multifurca ochricompacta TaxID=376703 RepID=A0AAD4M093_9AGAM|nr:hypothetical protein B0F90DRAFT_1939935 [Multifurca ochricompacta]